MSCHSFSSVYVFMRAKGRQRKFGSTRAMSLIGGRPAQQNAFLVITQSNELALKRISKFLQLGPIREVASFSLQPVCTDRFLDTKAEY
jgi:hypothetical protein